MRRSSGSAKALGTQVMVQRFDIRGGSCHSFYVIKCGGTSWTEDLKGFEKLEGASPVFSAPSIHIFEQAPFSLLLTTAFWLCRSC